MPRPRSNHSLTFIVQRQAAYNQQRRDLAIASGRCPCCGGTADRLPQFKSCTGCAQAKAQQRRMPRSAEAAASRRIQECLCGRPAHRVKQGMGVCARCDAIEGGGYDFEGGAGSEALVHAVALKGWR